MNSISTGDSATWLPALNRPFVMKELRQCGFVLLLGCVAVCFALFGAIVAPPSLMLFSSGEAVVGYASIVVPLAIALGLCQSFEFNRRSSIFLLHMPVSRQELIRTKLAMGLAALVAIVAVPILVAGLAFSIGSYRMPFFWSMTADLWRLLLTSTMIYLTAFLCGIRPANWFATRLLPIVGICFFGIAIQAIPYWWLIGPLLIVGADYFLVTTILHFAETRDYA